LYSFTLLAAWHIECTISFLQQPSIVSTASSNNSRIATSASLIALENSKMKCNTRPAKLADLTRKGVAHEKIQSNVPKRKGKAVYA